MKTNIDIYCDVSTNTLDNKIVSKLVFIIKIFKKNYKDPIITIIDETDNNKAELINVVNAINKIDKVSYSVKKNYPITIYSDSRYAVDILNQFLVYVKKMRGQPYIYRHFLCKGTFLKEKNNKYYKFKKCCYKLEKSGIDTKKLIILLMNIMNTNKISFKWINRKKNQETDKLAKFNYADKTF